MSKARKGDRIVLGAALCSALSGACGHGAGAGEGDARLTKATAQLERMGQEARKRERRIAQLESRLALLEAEQRELRYSLAETRGPLRETVRIGAHVREAAGAEDRAEAKARSSRPILRIDGRGRSRGPLQPVPTVSERLRVAPLPAAPSGGTPQSAKDAYRRALGMLKERQFKEAAGAFNRFLVRYPGDKRGPLAMFWRGEALFATQQYARAIEAFEGSMARSPKGQRAPDALWKIAVCHKRLGASKRARSALERLKTQFPESDAARQASREDA